MLTDRDFPQVNFQAPLPDGAEMTKKEREGEFAYLFGSFNLAARLLVRRTAEYNYWRSKGLMKFAREIPTV